MVPNDDDPLAAVLPHLTQLSNALNRGTLFERTVAAAGITLERPALAVLGVLRMADQPLRIGEIATRMQVAGPHATRQVQGLEQRGLVHRVADPHDQRARLIALTPEGTATADRYMRTLLSWFTAAMADWPTRDREELGRLLGRMVEDVTAHLASAEAPEGP
ncbi:MarR family winged helix-turn-helix transcriptional regulator [Streptomyces coffeae]|uniref:MarR family transcriptional regulator n=1 Tax=Streptomyces coffeae TaxID=621382 RepID=A0ABS1NHT4_9ACTN|nr:MarR family transcriptional regulator [Streptomyces coffeae]MBL1099664.1 MarR family transcriptional regulator [Streptomyces coffeae]